LVLALPEGFEINTYAEPFEVDYPPALTAAGDGTVYVSVDHNGSLGKLPEMGKVVACRDTDGDGKADKFVDFVQSVDSPRGGHFVGDTLYLIHPPFLSSFRDTTGDGVADEHKVLLENIGFDLRHPRGSDHTTNGCRKGIDGWLYIAAGSKFMRDYLIESVLNPGSVVAQGFQTVVLTMKKGKGRSHPGFITREQDGMVEVRDIAGTVTNVKASEIRSRSQLGITMMPAGLTTAEFTSLIEYLVSLKEKK
jgi:putative heme-binding domain-containing protein